MELVRVTMENIEKEHICCAISNDRDAQVMSKKAWLKERFAEGLVFLKGDVRGKCFIEYLPAESAWLPVEADGYMAIDCFWVSGQFKGKGNSNLLLEECIRDSKEKGKLGLCILSSAKKLPFLSDPGYLKYKGFQTADTAEPFFELLYLPFTPEAAKPCFKPQAKHPQTDGSGFVLYYTNQCPFNAKYVPLIEETAKGKGIPFQSIHLDRREKAQNAPAAATISALFYNGRFLTNEILSPPKFEKLAEKLMKEPGDEA